MRKRVFYFILCWVLLVGIVGCGSNNTTNTNSDSSSSDDSVTSTTVEDDDSSLEYEFKEGNVGIYKWVSNVDGSNLVFELDKKDDSYSYIIEYYPNGSAHASEELWGLWDTTKMEFTLSNDNTNSLASYQISDIKYESENTISFEIKAIEISNSDYASYVIPDGNYTLSK